MTAQYNKFSDLDDKVDCFFSVIQSDLQYMVSGKKEHELWSLLLDLL